MKIRHVTDNRRKGQLELRVYSGAVYPFPYARLDPRPSADNPIVKVRIDQEFGNEAVTYVLHSGNEGTVHIDHALEYNEDPTYLSELLVHKLSVEAKQRIDRAGLSRREVARRLNTSLAQIYRLLDPANKRKSINQLVSLLHVLDCDVALVVRARPAA